MTALATRLARHYCVHCLLPTARHATSHARCQRAVECARRRVAHVQDQTELGRFVASELLARVSL